MNRQVVIYRVEPGYGTSALVFGHTDNTPNKFLTFKCEIVSLNRNKEQNTLSIIFDGAIYDIALADSIELEITLAYALTRHTKQGADSENIIIILPDNVNFIERSWIYTAMTRATSRVIFIGQSKIIKDAIQRGNASDLLEVGFSLCLDNQQHAN